jgi:hypothetical protein
VDVDKALDFPEALRELAQFAEQLPIVCMNADELVMHENCKIHALNFPLPSFHRIRPLLVQRGFDVLNNSSGDLHKYTPEPLNGHTHDALHDARSMSCWLKHNQVRFSDLSTGAPSHDPRSTNIL